MIDFVKEKSALILEGSIALVEATLKHLADEPTTRQRLTETIDTLRQLAVYTRGDQDALFVLAIGGVS